MHRNISAEFEGEFTIHECCIEVRLFDLVVLNSNMKAGVIKINEFNYQVLSQDNYIHIIAKIKTSTIMKGSLIQKYQNKRFLLVKK
jgi:hypothetical protein